MPTNVTTMSFPDTTAVATAGVPETTANAADGTFVIAIVLLDPPTFPPILVYAA